MRAKTLLWHSLALCCAGACKGAIESAIVTPKDTPVVAGATATQDLPGIVAVPASSLLNSLGVCTHVGQGVDDPAKSADAMRYAGLRNFRDDGNPQAVPGWLTMHQRAGVRGSIITNSNIDSTLTMAKQLYASDALLAVEGPNEPNNFPVTYQGKTSDYHSTFMPVAQLQRDLY
ncbi:MAG TPA: hypothetical protein VFX59_25155, partial [Polyangiales bacterium]|nr:hypothetical protein [Polyangiales bacterium]